ncbi:MAG TPA: peptidoglycan-binding domain-containing protein [Microbacteriaceae bacterium]|nr:peptidoglycan-binding domain-containing protein [Microbacteriaceae bacterium]
MSSSSKRSKSRARWWVGGVLGGIVLLAAGAAVGWAGSTVFAPPPDVLDSTPYTTAEVVQGEVGSSINLNTVAEWKSIPIAANLASGTVTSVAVGPGQEVGVGSVLYAVNLRPVVIAQGAVPAFRSLARDTVGADVAQLQAMLTQLGFYSGDVSGDFGWRTQQAVEDWQASLGLDDDGVVQAGDLVFVPTLPTRISLDAEKVVRGASIGAGDPVISGLPAAPGFRVPVTDAQSAMMPDGTRVEITGPNGEAWEGFVTDRVAQQQGGTIDVILSGPDGAPVCGADCGSISVTEQSLLRSRIVTVETVTGLTVPSAALVSRADGTIAVVEEDGTEHRVTVVTSARGMSVIEGVSAGTRVRVPVSGT